MAASTVPLVAQSKPRPLGNYDVRYGDARAIRSLVAPAAGPVRTVTAAAELRSHVDAMRQGLAALQSRAPGASMRIAVATAAPELVTATEVPLSAAAPGVAGIDVVRSFLRDNQALYGLDETAIEGLRFIGESKSPSGLRMVRVVQELDGLPIFGSETRFLLDRDGRVWRSIGALVPSRALAKVEVTAPRLSSSAALGRALATVGIELDSGKVRQIRSAAGASEVTLAVTDERVAGEVPSRLVYFPVAPGVLVPAWRHFVFTAGDADWSTIVDADSGQLLWRKNMRNDASTQNARFDVYVQADGITPADSPAPQSPTTAVPGSGTQFPEIGPTTVSMFAAQDLVASPNGWIDDGGSTTTGNNVDACLDAVLGPGETNVCDIGALDDNGRPVGNPDGGGNNRDFLGTAVRDFVYTPPPSGGDPDLGDAPTLTDFRRGAVTQLFYVANWYHDRLFQLGFDEAAGNFQQTNFSGMGLGGDRVLADAQDGSGTNNANFSTPPDGTSGRAQMFRFTFPNPDRDGDLDSEILIHELTHGTSNRLIGNADGLIWMPGQGLGEGWSDFYALSLLNSTNADDPDARYASGAYATYQIAGLTDNYVYGIRRFPYSTDNSVNPLTWGDVDDVTADMSGGIPPSPIGFELAGGLEVHNAGEIWALTLWEVRSRVIADPAGANGDVPTGNQTMLQLVTDAMKMTPNNPSFVDARDALLLADCATNACANERWIWEGFADRGLGYGAVAPLGQAGIFGLGHMSVGESFDVPYLDVDGVTIDDSSGNNDGAIDPGEPILLTVGLRNPWLSSAFDVAAGATATLTTSTPGVAIFDADSTYPAIGAQATETGDSFLITVSAAATCGQSLRFTLTVDSTLGTRAVDFTVRVGTPAGTGSVVTYTSTPALAIPDADQVGVFDTLAVPDDLEIADLDLRIDSLTHTYTGDLTAMLRAPNGYGTDLIWLRGALFAFGNGDNFVDTVIDDEATDDLNQAPPATAPFTGSWLPAYNSPVWNLFLDPALFPDAVGQLGRLDGLSTQGDWTLHVADLGFGDLGTLDSWSLLVTPRAFSCAAFAPAAAVTATKTVSGPFGVGETVTYTIVLTNDGTAAQADNPGDELTDVLPAGLTLVSANATAGTAVANTGTNTVTWNGSLAPLGGSVTVTITATIDAGTEGQPVSNQGDVLFDADGDGSNETAVLTDDPGVGGTADPTTFLVAGGASVSATKTVTGIFAPGGSVTYTIVLTNSGPGAQPDNPGDELVDVLPAGLTLVSANATAGTATADVGTGTVTWNGSIAAPGSVTITIQATIDAGVTGDVSNQATVNFDADGNGTNESSAPSDDPGQPGLADPTTFGLAVAEIPALSELAMGLLALLLMAGGWAFARRLA